ncbi:MAG: c-type cytochrome biogenesis protein CcsB, partial [Leifsonia xyli]
MKTEDFEAISLVLIYSALVVYVFAFVAFALDLAARSVRSIAAQDVIEHRDASAETERGSSRAAAGRGTVTGVAVIDGTEISPQPVRRGSRFARVGVALTAIAWILHVVGAVLRGLADGHVPWSNMYEFAMIGTGVMAGLFLGLNLRRDIRFLGTFITGIVVILLGLATVNLYVPVTPLSVPLQSPWLVIHVSVATLGTGFFAIGAGLSIMQLLQARHARRPFRGRLLDTLPAAANLESLAYRVIVVGFVFWTFTLIAGAIWAEHSWGRYWGWDTKEVWTFIIWV